MSIETSHMSMLSLRGSFFLDQDDVPLDLYLAVIPQNSCVILQVERGANALKTALPTLSTRSIPDASEEFSLERIAMR